jgi:TP901 family phage tail tape measure protein
MAKNAFNLTAQINLQGPSNLRTIVADIRRQVGTINVDINPNINPSAYRSITGLNRVFRDLNTTLAITETNARTTAAALQNLAQAVNSIGGRNLQQNINNAANAAQNLSRQANSAAQGVNTAATGMEQFGRQSALAVRRFAALTTVTSVIFGLTTAIRSGISAFIDFDKEFVRLKQVSDSGSAALGLLAKTITDLSVNLGVSSKELTTVSVTLAQAGLSIRDTEKALQALAKSALAPSFDNLNDTVEGSIALMRQFSISSDQLESALGSVNAVAAAFAVEASDLIAAIQRTGGVFATASKGVSEGTDALNEFLAIFTSVRQTTRESAETIATGLRTIFTRIQRGGTIEALKEYGIVLTDLEDKFVGPFEAVKRLSEGLSRLDPRDIRFSSIIEELGGFRQIGKVIPLIQQFAVAQQALKVAQKGSDSLAKDAATAQLSLANQIAKVREEFLALIRSIGQSESFRSFVSLALDLTSGLIKLADAAKIVLPALTALGAIRGLSALTQFSAGFAGSFAAAGGARGLGQRVGGGRRFATGGLVPGSGNTDSVRAMLTPGEFVLRKSVVEDVGAGNLRTLNSGGLVQKFNRAGKVSSKGIDWTSLFKGRGKKGPKGPRARFDLPQPGDANFAKWQREIYAEYDADPSLPRVKANGIPMPPEIAYVHQLIGEEVFRQNFKSSRRKKPGQLKKTPLGLIISAAKMPRGARAPAGEMEKIMAGYQQSPEFQKEAGGAGSSLFSKLKAPLSSFKKEFKQGTTFGGVIEPGSKNAIKIKEALGKLVAQSSGQDAVKAKTALNKFDSFIAGATPDNPGQVAHFTWAMNQIFKKGIATFGRGGIAKFNSGGLIKKYSRAGEVKGSNEDQIMQQIFGESFRPGSGIVSSKKLSTGREQLVTTTTKRIRTTKNLESLARSQNLDLKQLQKAREVLIGSSALSAKEIQRQRVAAKLEKRSAIKQNRVLDFGLVGLRYGSSTKDKKNVENFNLPTPSSFQQKKYNINKISDSSNAFVRIKSATIGEKLKKGQAKNIQDIILNKFEQSVVETANNMGGRPPYDKKLIKKSINNSEFYNVVGAALEASLGVLGAPIIPKTEKTKSIDFPIGLGPLSKIFGAEFANIPTDVTRTIGGEGKGIARYKQQIARWLATPAGKKYITAKNPNITGFADGGSVNGFVQALLTPGEAVIDPALAKSVGYAKLNKMNYADKYAGGGSVGIVPGTGNGDTFGPVPLPVGSFVIRKKATKALGLNKGGLVQKFAAGGNVENNESFKFTDLFNNVGLVVGGIATLSAAIVGLVNNFDRVSTNVRTFGQNLVGANRGLGSGGSAAREAYREARASGLDRNAARAQVRGGRFDRFLQSPTAYLALAAGGTAISGLGSLFDEKDKSIFGVSTGGVKSKDLVTNALGDALNYGAIGATIGSALLPGFGTAIGGTIGAISGLATGFISAAKATEEYEKAQMEAAAETIRNEQLKRAQEDLAKKADELNSALAKLLEVSINLSDKYNKASSYLDRFGMELQQVSRANAGLLSDLSGQGRISETSRLDEQVLKNISAYSTAEIAAVANKIGSLAGGGAEGKGLSDTIRAQKIIQEQLPTILRTTESKDVSGVLNELKQLFKLELGPQLSGPVTAVLNEIDEALGETILKRTGEGSNLNQIADDIQKLVGPVAESAQKVASNLLNQYNNALDEAIRLQNEWIATTEKANEINRKASTLRLEADLDLRRTLGQQISPAQENAPFEQNVRGLTGSLIRGGTTDPALIGQRIDALRQENVQREQRVAKLQAGPQSNATARAIEAEQEAMRKNKVAINEGTKAIELLADNSAAAANALNRIQVKQQQAKSFVELVKNLYSASPEERLQTNRQLSAFQSGRAALATGRGREFFSNQQAGKDFFAGFEVLKDILGPQLAAQIERAAVNALVQAGGIPLNTQFPSGVTAGETVALGTTGELRPDDPDKLAYDEAIERQRAALLEFEKLMRDSANLLQEQVKTIFGNLQNIFTALNRASADLKANIESLTAVRRNKGGLVYASKGALVDSVFKPRGRDTVPAMTTSGQPYMLEEGEMVINRRATNENYDLLKAINGGDNVDGMYAKGGGTIRESRQQRREAYEQRQAEARERFQEQKPGLARVLEARRNREQKERRENPTLIKAQKQTAERQQEEMRRTSSRSYKPKTQMQHEEDRGRRLFGGFLISGGDSEGSSYGDSAVSQKSIFDDLRATGERPLGYKELSLEDSLLADQAITNFINSYRTEDQIALDKQIKELKDSRKKADNEIKAIRIQEASLALAARIVTAESLGLKGVIDPVVGEVTPTAYYEGPGEYDYSISGVDPESFVNVRQLTADESDKLRKFKLQRQFSNIDDASAGKKQETQAILSGLTQQKQEIEASQKLDTDARNRINPYTGRLFDNRFQLKIAEDQAAKEGRTFAEIDEERKRKNKSAQDIAKRAKTERLSREQYAQEQAEYEARMKVASKKATEQRKSDRIGFQREENQKGYLGYLAGGISDTYGDTTSAVVGSAPAQSAGQFVYGLGEIGYGLGVGTIGAIAGLGTAVSTLGYRAAQYQGDLLGDKSFGPRSKLEDDSFAQGGIDGTINLLESAFAAYGTIGTGFDRVGRALTFDRDIMAETGESPGAKRQRQISESLPRNSSYVPLSGGYNFRIPSMGESFDVANMVAQETAMAALPIPAIPFAGKLADATTDILRSVDRPIFSIDDAILKPAGKALASTGGAKVSLPRPLAGQLLPEQQLANISRSALSPTPRSPTFGQRMMASMRSVDESMSIENAARIADVRTGTVRATNPLTGRVERIPEAFADNPEAFFQLQPRAAERVYGKNFEYNTGPLPQRTEAVVAKAQDAKATNIFEELDVEESFVDGLSPMQQSIIRNNRATSPVVSQTSSAAATPKQPMLTPMQQAIMDALALSDEQLEKTAIPSSIVTPKTAAAAAAAAKPLAESQAAKPNIFSNIKNLFARSSAPKANAASVATATKPAAAVAPKPAAAVAPKPAAAVAPKPAAAVAPKPPAAVTSPALEEARKAAEGLRFRGNVSDEAYTPYLKEWDEMMDIGVPNEYRTYGAGSKSNYKNQDITDVSKKLEEVALSSHEARIGSGSSPKQGGGVGRTRDSDVYGKNAYINDYVKDTGRASKTFGVVEQRLTRDTNRKMFQIYGDDPTGRRYGTVLYSIPLEEAEKLGLADKLIEKGYSRFARGGIVRGQSGKDVIPAMLTKDEFVVNNKDAAKNLEILKYINNGGTIKPQKMYDGGEAGRKSGGVSRSGSSASSFGGSYTLSLEDKSITFMQTFVSQLNTFGKDFNSYVTQLSTIKIPDKIEMVGRHSVEVNVNGAAAFEAIEEGVKSLINTEIGKKMNMLWNQSGGQLGESIPTGDFNTGASRTQV